MWSSMAQARRIASKWCIMHRTCYTNPRGEPWVLPRMIPCLGSVGYSAYARRCIVVDTFFRLFSFYDFSRSGRQLLINVSLVQKALFL